MASSYSEFIKDKLVIVVTDGEDNLVDYLVVKPGSSIDEVLVDSMEFKKTVYVRVFGDNVINNPSSIYDMRTLTWIGNPSADDNVYKKGKVIITLSDGFLKYIGGDSAIFHDFDYSIIFNSIIGGVKTEYVSSPVMKFVPELVSDSMGSQFPKDVTPREKAFIEQVYHFLKNGKIESLRELMHINPDREYKYDIDQYFKEDISLEVASYKFTRMTKKHPEYEDVMKGSFEIEPKWLVNFQTKNKSKFPSNEGYPIAEVDGELKFVPELMKQYFTLNILYKSRYCTFLIRISVA